MKSTPPLQPQYYRTDPDLQSQAARDKGTREASKRWLDGGPARRSPKGGRYRRTVSRTSKLPSVTGELNTKILRRGGGRQLP